MKSLIQSKKVKAALLTGGLFFILFLGWLKLGEIYNANKTPASYAVMDYLEKNHFLTLPGLQFKDIDENKVDINQFSKNQVYIINFWASWCEPCAQEFPSMVKLLKLYEGKIHILAISNDSSSDDIKTFAKAFELAGNKDLSLLWDKDKELSKLFQVGRLPESFIFDKNGRLIRKIVGTRDWFAEDAIQYFKQITAE